MKTSPNKHPKLILLLFLLLTLSCSQTEYPNLSSTENVKYNYGQIIWHDLITPNPKQAMDFYANLFGWTYKSLGTDNMAYHVIYNGSQAIGGIIPLNVATHPSGEWLSSISVPDVDKAVTYNTSQGGKTLFKPANFKGRGRSALVQDPQGAYIAFIHSESGDPQFMANTNAWLWNELWTNDIDGSLMYYKVVSPYKTEEVKEEKVPYYLLQSGDQKLGGIMKNPVEGMRSAWLPYIRVNNVETVSAKAISLGAKMMLEPQTDIRNGSVAIIQDPNGAPFAIQFWNN